MTAKWLGRLMNLALAAALLVGMLAGCESKEEDVEQESEVISDEASQPEQQDSDISDIVDLAEYASLFKKDTVMTINVEINEADWAEILANPTAEEYRSVTITVNGNTLENVGFRTKGNSTLRSVAQSDSDRYSFRIKFDKYEDGQTLLGLDEMVVNNNYSDPSYMREYLTYEALDAIGAQVPLTAYVDLSINGEPFGFYLGVEAVDDSLLERFYGNSKGNLYKADERSTLVYEEGSEYTTLDQKNGKDKSREDLREFIRVLNEMPDGEKGDIESVLDVDSALRYIAAQTMLGNYDSYNGSFAHNYFLCANDGIFSVIPWDYNMSFGGFTDGGGESSYTIPIDEPVYGVTMESRPLINNLLAVPEYLERYHGYIEQLVDYMEGLEDRIAQVADIIRTYVEQDPTKFYTMEQFESNLVIGNSGSDNEIPPTPVSSEVSADGENGEPQTPPGGNRQGGGQRGWGGPGGMQSGGSILEYAVNRVENVKKQLSGELETTGNTTMEGGGRGFGGGGQRPEGMPDSFPEGMGDFDPDNFTPPEGFDPENFTPPDRQGEGGPPGQGDRPEGGPGGSRPSDN